MRPNSIKNKAIEYRKLGYSYGMISEILGLSKSTLSDWLREIPFTPNQEVLSRIKSAQIKSALYKHEQRMHDIQCARKIAKSEVGELTKRDLMMLGIGIYLGEGAKLNENIRIINSDPQIIRLAIKWFKGICGLSIKNFVPSVHLYPDNDVNETIDYWSSITGIPLNQFGKTQIDLRQNKSQKKRNKLPYGTLHLQIKSHGEKEFGRSLHRRIIGWIEAVTKQI